MTAAGLESLNQVLLSHAYNHNKDYYKLEFILQSSAVPHTNAKIQEPERFILNNYWDEFLDRFSQDLEEARLRKLAVLQVEPQMQDLKIKKNLTDQEQQTEPVRSADFLVITKLMNAC